MQLPCLQRAAVPAVLTLSHPEVALSSPEWRCWQPAGTPSAVRGRQGRQCCPGLLHGSECGMGGSGEGVLSTCSEHQGHSSVQSVLHKDIVFFVLGGQLKGLFVLCIVLAAGF